MVRAQVGEPIEYQDGHLYPVAILRSGPANRRNIFGNVSIGLRVIQTRGFARGNLPRGHIVPHTIVFDTNYIKSFSPLDYLDGRLPRKMANQIDLAFHRGDLVALVETVRMETNAWLTGMLEEKQRDLSNALRLLTDAGYNITPATVSEKSLPDIATIMQASNKNVAILTPTIEDYREAERRTSYRLPPLPKNPDGEEMRDRVIWCQLVRYSADGKNPVLIVARDKFFLNGSNSQEGKRFDVSCVEGEADLDQHLGQRPPHVQAVVDHVLHFALPLQERGIMLTADNILGIEDSATFAKLTVLLVSDFH